jgi:hypothetical protein
MSLCVCVLSVFSGAVFAGSIIWASTCVVTFYSLLFEPSPCIWSYSGVLGGNHTLLRPRSRSRTIYLLCAIPGVLGPRSHKPCGSFIKSSFWQSHYSEMHYYWDSSRFRCGQIQRFQACSCSDYASRTSFLTSLCTCLEKKSPKPFLFDPNGICSSLNNNAFQSMSASTCRALSDGL